MRDDAEQDLKDRLTALAAAVPVQSIERLAPTVRSTQRVPLLGLGVVAVVVLVLVMVLAGALSVGGLGRSPAPTSATDTVENGSYRLTIHADASRYATGAPIAVAASVEYLGPSVTLNTSSHPGFVGFGVREVSGPRHVSPAYDMSLVSYTFQRGVPVTYDFQKSGGTTGDPTNDAFVEAYLNEHDGSVDPVLRLPTGTWQVYAVADLAGLTATVTVEVGGAAASPVSSVPAVTSGSTSLPPSSAGLASSPTLPPPDVALPYPDGCAAYGLSPRRCAYIVDWAKRQAGCAPDQPLAVNLLGDPDCHGSDPGGCFVPRTTAFIVRVRLIAADGHSSDVPLFCGVGGQYSLLCSEHPQIKITSPTINGYFDVPCSSENGPCASPLPPPDADVVNASKPLRVPSLDIAIDHAGAYSINLGEAVLPNGLLTEATFKLGDDAPTDVLLAPQGMNLAIASLDGGLPFDNAYAHGWHAGTERVSVTLTFSVDSFDPGAVLRVRNLVVR